MAISPYVIDDTESKRLQALMPPACWPNILPNGTTVVPYRKAIDHDHDVSRMYDLPDVIKEGDPRIDGWSVFYTKGGHAISGWIYSESFDTLAEASMVALMMDPA